MPCDADGYYSLTWHAAGSAALRGAAGVVTDMRPYWTLARFPGYQAATSQAGTPCRLRARGGESSAAGWTMHKGHAQRVAAPRIGSFPGGAGL